jgi:hypothetical protein
MISYNVLHVARFTVDLKVKTSRTQFISITILLAVGQFFKKLICC